MQYLLSLLFQFAFNQIVSAINKKIKFRCKFSGGQSFIHLPVCADVRNTYPVADLPKSQDELSLSVSYQYEKLTLFQCSKSEYCFQNIIFQYSQQPFNTVLIRIKN